jgi:3-oxoacyl-[acyl-carrier-protein] synthase-3
LLEPTTDGTGITDTLLKSDGSGRAFLHMKAGGSARPASHETVDAKEHFVFQDGGPVFKAAVSSMADVVGKVMERNDLTTENLSWLVPHQANKRIIDAVGRFANVPSEKVMLNIHKYGNTTNGTIPLCLWEYEHQLKKGDNLILTAFGGGFTWGAVYIKWSY